jgi:hypothetical protein
MGVKKNLYVYLNLGLKNQKYEIDVKGKKIFSEYTGRRLNIFDKDHKNDVEQGKQLKMNKEEEDNKVDPRIKKLDWNIQLCDAEARKSLNKVPATAKPAAKAKSKV